MNPPRRRRSRQPADQASSPLAPWVHGLAALGDERWEEAITAFTRFLEMPGAGQERWKAYQNLSTCYLELERYDEALAVLDEVRRAAPDDPDTLYSQAITLACAGRVSEAVVAFENFADRWPKLARQRAVKDALRKLRHIEQGEIPRGDYLVDHLQEQVSHNMDVGDWPMVERKARRMMAANPQRPEGYFALGVACLEQNRYAEAQVAWLAAQTREEVDDGPTLCNLGYVCPQLDEPEQALTWLGRSLKQRPNDLPTLHHLGIACEKLGQREDAIAWWRRALTIDPNCALAQHRLHEVGAEPSPVEPPLTPQQQQLSTMLPLVKARMTQPRVCRNGGITLTYDPRVGFVLEDEENPLNFTIHAGGPFRVGHISEADLRDLMGVVKLTLRMIDEENTREVAILTYYADRPIFNYQLRFERKQPATASSHSQFVVTEAPRFFKLRIDSDLPTPYAAPAPMQGTLIYLSQPPERGILINTPRLGDK